MLFNIIMSALHEPVRNSVIIEAVRKECLPVRIFCTIADLYMYSLRFPGIIKILNAESRAFRTVELVFTWSNIGLSSNRRRNKPDLPFFAISFKTVAENILLIADICDLL